MIKVVFWDFIPVFFLSLMISKDHHTYKKGGIHKSKQHEDIVLSGKKVVMERKQQELDLS